MKAQRPYPRATITPKGEHALVKGHPWVYEAEVLFMEGAPGQGDEVANGSLIDVVNRKGSYLGTGLLSKSSKIRIRLITRNANDAFDRAFWKRKVAWAWEYRKTVMGEDASCCRVLFSEADGFPGLVVDRFNDVLVAETLSVGMGAAQAGDLPGAARGARRGRRFHPAACTSATTWQPASWRALS